MSVAQRIGLEGEMKLIGALTMENIADTVIGQGLASRNRVETLTRELYSSPPIQRPLPVRLGSFKPGA